MTASKAALFDFDGTLADTAADLCAALNEVRRSLELQPLEVSAVRPYASMGARGMVRIGFGLQPGDSRYEELRDAFLRRYEENVFGETRVFPGVAELLRGLEEAKIAWGIVTNKAMRFTSRLVEALGLEPDCVVGGDSTPHLKPHPAPLLLAAKELSLAPQECCYVGDDLRDVQAARAAGMRAVAVEWGYVSPDNGEPRTWNADAVLAHPRELFRHL